MSTRAARYATFCVAVVTAGMMSYVFLRVNIFKLSYAIDRQERVSSDEREMLRTLRYEVARMKALPSLKDLSARLDQPLSHPAQVKISHVMPVLPAVKIDVTGDKIGALSFFQESFSKLSWVPEALAKTESRSS
jgi:hypothetical protein